MYIYFNKSKTPCVLKKVQAIVRQHTDNTFFCGSMVILDEPFVLIILLQMEYTVEPV